jgi:hypothetical protein
VPVNRYTAAGVLDDMRDGKRVLVLSTSGNAARAALYDTASLGIQDGETVRRANGQESITRQAGGWVRFQSIKGSLRGLAADVAVIDADPSDYYSIEHELELVMASSTRAEVIRQ